MAVWMAYATLVGVLLSLAGWLMEALVRGRGGATRWPHVAAMALSVSIPAFALLPARAPAPREGATQLEVEAASVVSSPALFVFEAPLRATSNAPIAARDYDAMLLLAWAAMSGVLAVCFSVGWVGLRRRRATWTRAQVEGVDVLIAPDAGPAAVGMVRSRIVLPSWALDADRDALALMVAHEAEHVRARDPLLLGVAGGLLALMPWNATLWWQAARLRQAIELDCDARVLRERPDPRAYASVLLDVARGESRWLLASPGMARRRSLERRIRMLAGARRWGRTASSVVALGALGFIAVACSVEPPARATDPQPAATGGLTAGQQRQLAMEMAGSRHAIAVRSAIERNHPELLTEGVAGSQAYVWLMANTRGELERSAVDTVVPTWLPDSLVWYKWPDVDMNQIAGAGVVSYPAGTLGPDIVTVMWWERRAPDAGPTDIFEFGFDPERTNPTTEQLRAAVASRFPGVLEGRVRTDGVWFVVDREFEVRVAGRDESFTSSALFEDAIGGRYGVRFSSVLMTSLDVAGGGHVTLVWAELAPDSPLPRERRGSRIDEPEGTALPAPVAAVDTPPVFTPMTAPPTIRNAAEVSEALRNSYPPVLRDAGVTGTAIVWFLIDEDGELLRTSIHRSSGHEVLDQAALRVAETIEFTPARNGDRPVQVWIQLPIEFRIDAESTTPDL